MRTFRCSPELRWSDQDMQGHVNNARILTLVEEVRVRWLHDADFEEFAEHPRFVAHQAIDYLAPVLYGPELVMEAWVGAIGRTSYTLHTRGFQNGAPVFDSDVVLVSVDPSTHKPVPVDEEERAFLATYMEDSSHEDKRSAE